MQTHNLVWVCFLFLVLFAALTVSYFIVAVTELGFDIRDWPEAIAYRERLAEQQKIEQCHQLIRKAGGV